MPDRHKIYIDIVRLHEAIETIESPLTARNQGMTIYQVPNDLFLNQLGTFKPALFQPRQAGRKTGKGKQKQKAKEKEKEKEMKRNSKTKRKSKEPPTEAARTQTTNSEAECAAPASASSPSSPSSTSTTRAHRSFSLWPSTSSPPRPSSSCSSLSFGTFEPEPWLPEGSRLPVYPPVLKHVAEMNECERGLPALPGWGECVLEKDGLTSKAKHPYMHNLELHEDGQWEITEILEDHTYKRPHCVAELFLNPTHQMDSRMISLTEIKAVLRLMRNRMELRRYAHHSSFPVLMLSYVSCGEGDDAKCKPARIIQAHHDGKRLTIQYLQLANWVDRKTTASTLGPFAAYFFSEPVMPIPTSPSEKPKRGSWLQGKWTEFTSSRSDPMTDSDLDKMMRRA
ncbi:hypothetical protein ASPCAL04695 [Aspergillus calidoustus]|uniref:Uncharacterized protein n=1 Tax=Aspergillus calidoustus TaxID=454130 RepID=A0A0U4Z1S5_ASPCI|nr:hypothetical protein ASPCAL04695 [Aspergillus calidoustus]